MKFFPLIAACGVRAAVIREPQQVPILEHTEVHTPHLGEEGPSRPSIGVHFTSSHAVPAARYSNGTILDLATIEGDAEYIDLMSRWMTQAPELVPGEQRAELDWCKTYPHHEECGSDAVQRQSSHDFDDPIIRDTAILSKILMQVRIAVETELNIPMTTFAPVFFELRQNQTQAVQDALELVGLQSTHSSSSIRGDVLLDTNAAYAGTGAFLCKAWMDPETCREEKSTRRDQTVLFLDFDNHSFSTSVRSIRGEATSHSIGSRMLSSELGWWDLPVFKVPRAKFWARVHEAILDAVGVLGSQPIDRIVLTGEHGGDEEFKGVAEAAIWSALGLEVGSMLQTSKVADTGRVTARGAAEMAWRREYWRSKAIAYEASLQDVEKERSI
ncbi:hypothetical protein T440DRAFT_413492 [Plenodomus tracheiphilus IPT5]|uniref:Actin-like ATPase domain-containing protein n=1 Tax=Plenodomus tracheiphilus IPT5 TaxID=1408161 RepID=A0A6A7BND7_9PLEO|nr:hypothetical protein T440DRAFT_413492 [Plenodomus tracheiphilus IPT5]